MAGFYFFGRNPMTFDFFERNQMKSDFLPVLYEI